MNDAPGAKVTVYRAGAVRDAQGVDARPGAVAVDQTGRILAAGKPQQVLQRLTPEAQPETVELADQLLIPGLVNAHCHLDLTDLGPQSYGGDFITWVRMVIRHRREAGFDPIRAVERGLALSYASGTLTVGDIAGSFDATDTFRINGQRGVSFIELIGLTGLDSDFAAEVDEALTEGRGGPCRVGVQPHAPYSTGPATYMQALHLARKHDAPLTTHLAETEEEVRFVRDAAGPLRDMLEAMDLPTETLDRDYGQGLHPADWLRADPGTLVAHMNHLADHHIDVIAERGWSVAYCPRAAAYFGHRGHRYREMLDAGINVCLGTDSIVCHGSLSVLDEMRFLHQRDHTPTDRLLAMATTHGMVGLRLNRRDATFQPGARPGIVALPMDPHDRTDPLEQVLSAEAPPAVRVLLEAGVGDDNASAADQASTEIPFPRERTEGVAE